MLVIERRGEILNLLKQRKSVSVETLCETFFISGATARRDLDTMSREGLIKRTYGGAVLNDGTTNESPFQLRENENYPVKLALARRAAAMVGTGQTVFMDSSSTVLVMTKLLGDRSGLSVLTNGIVTATRLTEGGNSNVFCTGGKIRETSLSMVGVLSKEFISNYYADIVFFSCSGFDIESGITEANEEEAQIKREMIAHAKQVVLLCDSSKLGKTFFSKVCDVRSITTLVTDRVLPENDRWSLGLSDITVVIA